MSNGNRSSYTVTMKVMESVLGSDLRGREFPEIFKDSLHSFYVNLKYKIIKRILAIVSFPPLPTSSLEKECDLKLRKSKGVTCERKLHATATGFAVFISQHLLLKIG